MVYQLLTAVARPWRSRGLAKALKGALLRQVHESHPEARIMRTGNGETNAAMRLINAHAGFMPHRRFVEYQITREKLDHWREEGKPTLRTDCSERAAALRAAFQTVIASRRLRLRMRRQSHSR